MSFKSVFKKNRILGANSGNGASEGFQEVVDRNKMLRSGRFGCKEGNGTGWGVRLDR